MKIYYEATKLYRYFNHTLDNQDEETIHDLFSFAEYYLNLATLQIKRIKSIDEKLAGVQGRITEPKHREAIMLYFGDIHFFFSCVHKFVRISKRLIKKLGLESIPQLELLDDHYTPIRNHFEHIDERLENHPYFRKDVSSTTDDKIILQGVEYDLTENALIPLYTIYETILTKINEMIKPRKEDIDQAWKPFNERLASIKDNNQ